jgi:hypothetical protein
MSVLSSFKTFSNTYVLNMNEKCNDSYTFCNRILKHEFYKTYIKTRVRFAARLLKAGVPVHDECS